MPRYFFHPLDGYDLPDDVGHMCSDVPAARQQALRYAGALIAEMADQRFVDTDWKLDICDQDGLVLFSFMFFGLDGACSVETGRSRPHAQRHYHQQDASAVAGATRLARSSA